MNRKVYALVRDKVTSGSIWYQYLTTKLWYKKPLFGSVAITICTDSWMALERTSKFSSIRSFDINNPNVFIFSNKFTARLINILAVPQLAWMKYVNRGQIEIWYKIDKILVIDGDNIEKIVSLYDFLKKKMIGEMGIPYEKMGQVAFSNH